MWEKGKKYPQMARRGSSHGAWKGDHAGYQSIHIWLRGRKERTGICKRCGLRRVTHFANVSGLYMRDVDDYIEVCVPCHRKIDGQTLPDTPMRLAARRWKARNPDKVREQARRARARKKVNQC